MGVNHPTCENFHAFSDVAAYEKLIKTMLDKLRDATGWRARDIGRLVNRQDHDLAGNLGLSRHR